MLVRFFVFRFLSFPFKTLVLFLFPLLLVTFTVFSFLVLLLKHFSLFCLTGIVLLVRLLVFRFLSFPLKTLFLFPLKTLFLFPFLFLPFTSKFLLVLFLFYYIAHSFCTFLPIPFAPYGLFPLHSIAYSLFTLLPIPLYTDYAPLRQSYSIINNG